MPWRMRRPRGATMRSTRTHLRIGRLAVVIGVLLLVGACTEPGGDVRSPAPTGSLTPARSAEASDSTAGGYTRGDYGSEAPASSDASSRGPEAYVINTASGAVGVYLTGEDGRTLYTFKPDSANTSTCTGGCASTWPPFTAGGRRTPDARLRRVPAAD